jgi:hypothetical protein
LHESTFQLNLSRHPTHPTKVLKLELEKWGVV